MTTAVADTRVELAAAILAGWSSVRSRLADEPVRVGRVEQQAHRAFTRTGSAWQAFAEPGARRLAGDLHADYSAQLGALIDSAASKGLAVGVDLQLAKGVSPEVAWQRALVGYGLDEAGMRWFVNGAMKAAVDGSGGTVSAAMRSAVSAAILGRADHLADVECRAWEGAREAVTKAYDPHQPRDEEGQWARVGGRTAEKETKAAPAADPFANAVRGPFANAVQDPFAAATGDPFANAVLDPFEQAARDAPFRQAVRDPFAAAAADAAVTTAAKPRRKVVRRNIILAVPQKRHVTRWTPPDTDGTFMLPLDDMDGYFADRGKPANLTGFDHDPSGAVLDFGRMHRETGHVHGERRHRIEAQHTVGLSHLSVNMTLPEVDDDTWKDLVHEATRLHHIVAEDPLAWAETLREDDPRGFDEVWNMVSPPGFPNSLIDHFEEDEDAIAMGKDPPNADMVDALADYFAWIRPDLVDEDGAKFHTILREGGYDPVTGNMVGAQYHDDDLDFSRIPAVVNFPEGLARDDNAADMQGRYRVRLVDGVQYESGIRTGKSARMNGHIGVQMINLVPDDDRIS